MSLYEILSMFKALRRRANEREKGRMPDEDEFEDWFDNLSALSNDPSVVLN